MLNFIIDSKYISVDLYLEGGPRMAKPRTKWSESTYERYLKEGRGQGEGADYKPWLTIHSFASKGTVSRIPGRKTGRIHHLLSLIHI